MKALTLVIVCMALLFQCSGLNDVNVGEPKLSTAVEPTPNQTPEPTKPPIPEHIAELSTLELCERIGQIEVVPTRDPTITDPIYESLLAKGKEAVPCLVEKIGNATLIKDPRYSVPTWHSYAVGDTALFLLLDILSKDDSEWEKRLITSLPTKSQKEYSTNGIYAYFNYVLEPKNRQKYHQSWRKWLGDNKK